MLDRALLRKLLGMLGSDHDGESLNAARRIDAMVRQSGLGWDVLLPDAEDNSSAGNGEDVMRLDKLLGSDYVTDVLKIRLRDMRLSLARGKLSLSDRRLLRIIHRKAVIEGAIVDG